MVVVYVVCRKPRRLGEPLWVESMEFVEWRSMHSRHSSPRIRQGAKPVNIQKTIMSSPSSTQKNAKGAVRKNQR
jgi:hypothetical protein